MAFPVTDGQTLKLRFPEEQNFLRCSLTTKQVGRKSSSASCATTKWFSKAI